MRCLAFDTSTAQGSVAVFDGGRVLSERQWRREKSHSELLTAEIENALKDSGVDIKSIDALSVGQGPGSFTGIRVTINAARALGYALQKPVYVFETSEILVEPLTRFDLPVFTIVNAQKNSFYVSRFESREHSWKRTLDVCFVTLLELERLLSKPHLCLGDGCADAERLLPDQTKLYLTRDPLLSDFPLASAAARLAFSKAKSAPPLVWNAVQPLYIRASGAEEKLREGC